VDDLSGIWFEPKLVEVFSAIAQKEYFWLNLKVKEYYNILAEWGKKTKANINLGDLGKLIVPSEIIEKNGELTAAEFKVVKQHTFYTYRLLKRIEGLGSIPEWASFHHERLDGSGYPFRIQGSNLNIGSRIMAVSDIFQALTEDRPYRKAFSISKALKIIDEMQQESKLDAEIITVLKNTI